MNDQSSAPAAPFAAIVALWGIQDALLQQYRTIFITMQSIFLAVGTALLQAQSPWIPLGVLTILALVGGWLWVTVCLARGTAVYVIQYLGLRFEQGKSIGAPLKLLKDFQDGHHPEIRSDPQFRALLNGATRRKMEVILPSVFGLAWVCLWLVLVLQHYQIIVIQR